MRPEFKLLILGSIIILLAGCSKEVIEPELYGSIRGSVTDNVTNEGISDVSIETTPATEAIVTDSEGDFELNEVNTGSYLIKASKEPYNSRSVNVQVREDQTTTANIVLGGGEDASEFIQAEVTSWYQTDSADSSQVEVEYRVTNTSNSTIFSRFEVYFDIYNDQETLYFEVADTTLESGEINIGQFSREVREATVDSVVVSGTWIDNG